jgi:hypothetical protein
MRATHQEAYLKMAFFRFHKSRGILPGIRSNLSRSGPSLSLAPAGARLNVGPKGIRTAVGLRGSGLKAPPLSIDEVAALRGLDYLIWGFIGVVASIVLLSPIVTNFQIAWGSFLVPLAASALLIAGSWFYRARRHDPRLSSALGSTAQITMFAAVAAPLSYLSASPGLPFQDHALDAIDKALGFDWMGLFAWLNVHPTTFKIFRVIYFSLTVQITLVVMCLAFTGRLAWLRVFVVAFMCTTILTIAISAVVPAQGVWSSYGHAAADPSSIVPATDAAWPVYRELRDGTNRQLVATGAEGILTFPSLHAALAVIFIGAMWPIPGLRWLALATNAVMLAAIPIDGLHYFVDVLAGIAIAVLSLASARAMLRPSAAPLAPRRRA